VAVLLMGVPACVNACALCDTNPNNATPAISATSLDDMLVLKCFILILLKNAAEKRLFIAKELLIMAGLLLWLSPALKTANESTGDPPKARASGIARDKLNEKYPFQLSVRLLLFDGGAETNFA
jgi:hypothetical protein